MLGRMKFSASDPTHGPLSGAVCLRWARQQQRLIFVAILVVFALPAHADAKPGYRVHPGGTELSLFVGKKASSVISVSANDRQRVQFEVEKPSSTIEYSTKGRVSNRRIEADFGALGRVDVRLDLLRFGSEPSREGRCRGRGPLYGAGTYRGSVEFSHQRGVPEVSIRQGRVYFERLFRQVCKRRSPKFKPGPFPKLKRKIEEAVLTVRGKGEGRTVRLGATIFAFRRNPARTGGTLRAEAHERHEGVRITRWMGDFFDHGSFIMSRRGKKPETIEVELPEPFAGRALYSSTPGSFPSWTGDLSVDLPGTDGISLTGPGFDAALCRDRVDVCRFGERWSLTSTP